MKYQSLFFLLIVSISSFSQSSDKLKPPVEGKIYQKPEKMPEYQEGDYRLMEYIHANIQYPDSAKRNHIKGVEVIEFVVNLDGSISDLKIIQSVSWDIDKEALRLVGLLKKFKPGQQRGKNVRAIFTLPIIFKLSALNANVTSSSQLNQGEYRMPEFPGGDKAMKKFIEKSLKYPKYERENNIEGRVVVGFTINGDGSLSDIKISKGVSKGLDEEAMRVVKLFPNFKPGISNGIPVRINYVIPIMFKL